MRGKNMVGIETDCFKVLYKAGINKWKEWVFGVECKGCFVINERTGKNLRKQIEIKGGLCKTCTTKKIGYENKTHGLSLSRIYSIWNGMNNRCNNSGISSFKDYGGRGIKVMRDNFEDFYKDMGDTYKEGLTIERIDCNGNYCKKNCKWIILEEQSLNKRNTILINGIVQSVFCRDNNISPHTLKRRMSKGMSVKESINSHKMNRKYYQGKCYKEWSLFFGANYGTFFDHVKRKGIELTIDFYKKKTNIVL